MNISKFLENLDEEIKKIIWKARETADKLGYDIYLVGGIVRDLLLKSKNNDVDIVVEGDGLLFCEQMSQILKRDFKIYKRFKTGSIEINDKIKLDIITARKETYKAPADLPEIEEGSIKDDLYRRDFTINSMAIKINSREFGKLIDYFGGYNDLINKKIKILHDFSFIDDPTRIFRAIKFEQRFNFTIEKNTMKLLIEAVDNGYINMLTKQRYWNEVISLLKEQKSHKNVKRLVELGILKNLYDFIDFDSKVVKLIKKIDEDLNELVKYLKIDENIDFILLKITLLFFNCKIDNIDLLLSKLPFQKYYLESIKTFLTKKEEVLNNVSKEDLGNYFLYSYLNLFNIENILCFYLLCDDENFKKNIRYYISNLKNKDLRISGKDLIKLNIKPGKIYGYILKKVLEAKVNGVIKTYEEELLYAKKIYKKIINSK